jgi:hypothetical protein
MHIDDGVAASIDRFRADINSRLADHGRRANLALGEAFKLIDEL